MYLAGREREKFWAGGRESHSEDSEKEENDYSDRKESSEKEEERNY